MTLYSARETKDAPCQNPLFFFLARVFLSRLEGMACDLRVVLQPVQIRGWPVGCPGVRMDLPQRHLIWFPKLASHACLNVFGPDTIFLYKTQRAVYVVVLCPRETWMSSRWQLINCRTETEGKESQGLSKSLAQGPLEAPQGV